MSDDPDLIPAVLSPGEFYVSSTWRWTKVCPNCGKRFPRGHTSAKVDEDTIRYTCPISEETG